MVSFSGPWVALSFLLADQEEPPSWERPVALRVDSPAATVESRRGGRNVSSPVRNPVRVANR